VYNSSLKILLIEIPPEGLFNSDSDRIRTQTDT
jgi:hypothetical protein